MKMGYQLTVRDTLQVLCPLEPFSKIIIKYKDNINIIFDSDHMKQFAERKVSSFYLETDTNSLSLTLKER